LIRWLDIFYRQFFHALDYCHGFLHGMRFFLLKSKFLTLFFEWVHTTRPVVPCFLARPMFDVCMCMWGYLLFKRGQYKFPICSVGREVSDLLARKDNLVLNIADYSYMGMDWTGCPNIRFTIEEPPYERGNIIVMF
jgi:hypothetical protein